jgi:hypothetical protein
MSPVPFKRQYRRPARSAAVPATLAEDLDPSPDNPRPAPAYSHLEAGDEAIWFAIACVLASLLLYTGVVLSHVGA